MKFASCAKCWRSSLLVAWKLLFVFVGPMMMIRAASTANARCCLAFVPRHERSVSSLLPVSFNQPNPTASSSAAAAFSTRLFSSVSGHSSTSSGSSSPWRIPSSIIIPVDQIEFSFVRSSGAGGQNVNKVNTQVQLRFHVPSATWMGPDEVRQRFAQQQAARINKNDEFTLNVQEHRTQTANRKAALDKVQRFVLRAWPRPKVRQMKEGLSEKTKQDRIEFKRRRSQVKEGRRPVDF